MGSQSYNLKNGVKVYEFEIDRKQLSSLLMSVVNSGIASGDGFWIRTTTEKECINLCIKNTKENMKGMSKEEKTIRNKIAKDIERQLYWDNAPIQINSAINKTVSKAVEIVKGL